MMNSPFVTEQAKTFAASLLKDEAQSDAERLRVAYERTYSRPPSAGEIARSTNFLTRYEAGLAAQEPDVKARRQKAWSALCQVLLAANEFVYVN
jgi:hypothetical protein